MVIWEKWTPIKGIPSIFYIEKVLTDEYGLFITLKNNSDKKSALFTFDGSLLTQRCTKRKALLKTITYLQKHYGADFYDHWSLFKIKNSDYLEWFEKENSGIYQSQEVFHYVFMGTNEVFEVLAPYEPEIVIEQVK